MRRTMLTALGVMALALAVPGAALAHKGHGHHKGHHALHHGLKRRGHASVHVEHFGAVTASEPTGTGTGTGTETGTSNTPTTPPTPENAGTVTSYNSSTGLLTLTLNNKSTVEGSATSNTEIKCVKATPTTPQPSGQPSDQNPGDDNGQGDDQSRGDMSQQGDQQSWTSGQQWGDDDQVGSDDDEVQGTPEPPCDSSALVAGAIVRWAELRIGPAGSEFESIVLVR